MRSQGRDGPDATPAIGRWKRQESDTPRGGGALPRDTDGEFPAAITMRKLMWVILSHPQEMNARVSRKFK